MTGKYTVKYDENFETYYICDSKKFLGNSKVCEMLNKKDKYIAALKQERDLAIQYRADKIAELEKVLTLVKKDLLMRAEEDSDGCKVVDLSSSIWIKLKEALKEQGE